MYKHSHFMAHSSNVNCFRFGRKSGQVAVSGGDDNNVNIWRIRENETKNIMSLAGHSSPVECVIFDPSEKKVVAGSKSGAIKAYDMESAKVYRNLKGHMSNCTTIDYHLYGDYVASGALDTNVKIWDLKTKNCVQTFKGHNSEVTCVSFTPDGRWLTSGGADGSLKIWDLTAGKLLKEFSDHDGAIVCLAFNPEEYILVSSSADKTIRFWDVQNFELLGLTPTDNAVTTSIAHTISEPYCGKYALCGSQDTIKIWSYEQSVQCHDALIWNRDNLSGGTDQLGDTLVTDNLQLFGGSFSNAFVSIWRIELSQLQPFAPPPKPTSAAPKTVRAESATSGSTTQRRQPTPSTPSHPQESSTQMGAETLKRFSGEDGALFKFVKLNALIDIQNHVARDASTPALPSTELPPSTPPSSNASDYVQELRCGMEVSMRTIRTRQKSMEQYLLFWEKGDIHGGFRYLAQIPSGTRDSVVNDILGTIDLPTIGLDLEACVLLLPLASELLGGAYETHIETGMKVAKTLYSMFATLVKDNREARKNSREVNFASEDRAQRCDTCHRLFLEVKSQSQKLVDSNMFLNLSRELNEFRALMAEYGWNSP